MKINEITDKFKVMQSSPQGIKLAAQNGTEINLPPEQANSIIPDPQNPKSSVLNLNTPQQVQPTLGQPEQGQPVPTGTDQSAGQPVPTGEPAQGQPVPTGQQPQLPQVGSEVELADNVGSTMQTEKFNNTDLVDSGKNADISGDKTDDYINDITNDDDTYTSGRSKRTSNPIKESAELIAMLTIAGLR
jgi:hypothetical protein